jgi:F0F1-type ATP synthase epsilon subunit
MTQQVMTVTILSPETTLYEGTVVSLSCINKAGQFDILPFHSNFISLIYQSITVHPAGNQPDIKIPIGYALLKQINNAITILTNVDISSYTQILTAQANQLTSPASQAAK